VQHSTPETDRQLLKCWRGCGGGGVGDRAAIAMHI